MDAKSEHFRFYVLVESKRGQTPQQILQQLRIVFGDSAPGHTFVYKWFSEFRSGNRDSVQHLHNPGRPVSQRTDANISRVYNLITEQPKSTLVYLSAELLLSRETVRRILVDDLLFRKVCSVWIPHSLTEENKAQRFQCATNLIHFFALHSMDELLRLFAVQDETWVPFMACNTKEENKVWIPPQAKRPRTVRPNLTPNKTMVSLVFTGNGKVNVEVTERGETIDSDSYVNFVHTTGERWRKLKTNPTCLKELYWMHDNARPHSAVNTRAFFKKRNIKQVHQAPYSPDLNLCDRWLFKHVKKELRKCSLSCASDVREETLRIFRSIPKERFESELANLKEHCQLVRSCQGDYVTP
jgi:transposase